LKASVICITIFSSLSSSIGFDPAFELEVWL